MEKSRPEMFFFFKEKLKLVIRHLIKFSESPIWNKRKDENKINSTRHFAVDSIRKLEGKHADFDTALKLITSFKRNLKLKLKLKNFQYDSEGIFLAFGFNALLCHIKLPLYYI